jgi:hypothetical protein
MSPSTSTGSETPMNQNHSPAAFRERYDKAANDTVALLRAEAGRDPYDRDLSDLIGQLSTRSEEFRRRWAAHNVRIHTTGVKLLHHPVVGDLDLAFESFPLPADPGQSLLTDTAGPGSPTQDALHLLAQLGRDRRRRRPTQAPPVTRGTACPPNGRLGSLA